MAFSLSFLLDGKLPDEREGIGLSYCSIPSTQHRIGMLYLGFDTVLLEGSERRRKAGGHEETKEGRFLLM